MPDEVDELILKMQHLEAQVRAQREAQALEARGKSLRTRAQQLAWSAQAELAVAEAAQREGEEKLQRARDPGLKPIVAADLLEEGRRIAQDARTRVVKARARLNFALDQLDEAERREYEALHAQARAETHAQLAEDPMFKGPPSAPTPASPSTSTSPATSNPTSTSTSKPTSNPTAPASPSKSDTPKKTLGRRRPKGGS